VPRRHVLALLAALLTTPARADELRPLRWDPTVDGLLLSGSVGLLAVLAAAREPLGPLTCRFCAPNGFDAGARQALVLPFTGTARTVSGALTAGIALGAGTEALLVARAHGDLRAGLVDVGIIAESAALALDAALLLGHLTGRQRPYVHYADYPGPVHVPGVDDNLSFPAGQVTLAFSLAVAAGTVAYRRGSHLAPWVLGVGLGLAAVVGYLRVAGDASWATDALAGAALGSAAGVAVPWLLHPPEGTPPTGVRLVPAPGGLALIF
jgi:membrane-associated phospholipid phosphatase